MPFIQLEVSFLYLALGSINKCSFAQEERTHANEIFRHSQREVNIYGGLDDMLPKVVPGWSPV